MLQKYKEPFRSPNLSFRFKKGYEFAGNIHLLTKYKLRKVSPTSFSTLVNNLGAL